MAEQSSTDMILVLCHTFFHDAFRLPGDMNASRMKTWMNFHFLANFIIRRSARLPEGSVFATTSKPVFENFKEKFTEENPKKRDWQLLRMLKEMIEVIDKPSVAELGEDESVFTICETLYSRSSYRPILVTSMENKEKKAKEFYGDNSEEVEEVPFDIYGPQETVAFLKGKFPNLWETVENDIKRFDSLP